jgi:SPP1 family predicted phage head-tail adaptor
VIRAGELRHRVTIQDKVVTLNSYNEEVITWTDVDTVWAQIEDLRGREYLESRRQAAEVTTRIRIRYRSGLAPEMRAVWGDITYDIQAVVDPTGRQRELELMCTKVA